MWKTAPLVVYLYSIWLVFEKSGTLPVILESDCYWVIRVIQLLTLNCKRSQQFCSWHCLNCGRLSLRWKENKVQVGEVEFVLFWRSVPYGRYFAIQFMKTLFLPRIFWNVNVWTVLMFPQADMHRWIQWFWMNYVVIAYKSVRRKCGSCRACAKACPICIGRFV